MTYRILTLDGGGTWAVLQVMALAALYGDTATGHEVLRDFDLVASNSGGGLTLGGLVENRTLADLRDNFFRNAQARDSVFVRRSWLAAFPEHLTQLGPKYDTGRKLAGLRSLLARHGDTPLSQLSQAAGGLPDLVICTFDYDRLRGVLFRSNPDSLAASATSDPTPTLAEAIHASTNAPVSYFDAPARLPSTGSPRQFWDGGIAGANNPVLVAVAEALADGHAATSIRALSLGTGTTFLPFDPDHAYGDLGQSPRLVPRGSEVADLVADIRTLATAIVDDPPDTASYLAHLALGGPIPSLAERGRTTVSGPVVRLNPMIQPVPKDGGWAVPEGIADFGLLARTPLDPASDAEVEAIVDFGQAWLDGHVPNQPIRGNRTTLACEIGQPTFDRALAVWRDIRNA